MADNAADPSPVAEWEGLRMSLGSRITEACFLIAVAVWVGAIVMLAFVVAPVVFAALPRPEAGDLMNQLFPAYYRVGALCCMVALVTGGIQAYLGRRWGTLRFWLTGLMVVSTLYGGFVVTPHAQAVRTQLMAEGEKAQRTQLEKTFRRDHQLAMMANGISLVAGVLILWLTGVAERRVSHHRGPRQLSG
jgi:putative copper export protein